MADLLRLKNDLRTLPLARRRTFGVTAQDLAAGYHAQLANAPARSQGYFSTTRTGVPSTQTASSRAEEHLAIGLFNRQHLRLPCGGRLDLLDYQFPLKSVRADAGVGKIDLLGRYDDGTLAAIELKVEGNVEDRRIALLEGLIYAATVERNIAVIAEEGRNRGQSITRKRPKIILLGPPEYWSDARPFPGSSEVRTLACESAIALESEIMLMQLHDAKLVSYGRDGRPPEIAGACSLSHLFDEA